MPSKKSLTLDDPLAGQTVTLLITVAATGQPRDARPVLVSVAPAGQMPALRHGRFGGLPALIDAAWTTASGVQARQSKMKFNAGTAQITPVRCIIGL